MSESANVADVKRKGGLGKAWPCSLLRHRKMQAETDQSKISCEAEELKPTVDTPGDVAESDPERADPFVLPPDSQPSANADNLDNTDDTDDEEIPPLSGPDDPKAGETEREAEEEEYREISEDGWEDVLGSGRLRKRILSEGVKGYNVGEGRPNRGDVVVCNVKGFFQEEEFQTFRGLEFALGEAEVIQALDLVVALMNTAEVSEVIADPEFAYGDLGFEGESGKVPPKAAVRLEVELVSHKPPVPFGEISQVEEKLRIGRRKKDRGNFWFQRSNYNFAVQCYRKAGDYFDDEQLVLEVPVDRYQLSQELQTLLEERLKAFNNLAMAQMKLELWDAAMSSLRQVLRIEPNNEKALYRKSKILAEKGCVEEAIGALRRCTRLYPANQSAKTDLGKLVARQKKSLLNEQNLSRKMLGLDKAGNSKNTQDSFARRAWNFLAQNKFMVTSITVGLGSLAAAVAFGPTVDRA